MIFGTIGWKLWSLHKSRQATSAAA